jgi:hypothetical protein
LRRIVGEEGRAASPNAKRFRGSRPAFRLRLGPGVA